MGDLSTNFSRSEFACQGARCCGHSAPIDEQLVSMLQALRDRLCQRRKRDVPLHINSGFRCNKHNASIKMASPNSKHRFGIAADIATPEGFTVDELAEVAESVGFGGIGKYDWGIHVDRRAERTRWDYR